MVGAPLIGSVVVASHCGEDFSADAVATSGIYGGGVVRGSLASIYGSGFATQTLSSATPVAQLGGITVLIGGASVGLEVWHPIRAIFLVPLFASEQQTVQIVVAARKDSGPFLPVAIWFRRIRPSRGIFGDQSWSPVTWNRGRRWLSAISRFR